MKAFYIVLLLVFLASCGSEVVEESVEVLPTVEAPVIEMPQVDRINDALDELPQEIIEEIEAEDAVEENDEVSEEVMEAKVVKLEAPYTNPKGPVDMVIEYSLDSEGKVETIDVSATTYDLSKFNISIQAVVGMSIEEASEYYVSGSSLTTASYQAALQN